MLEGKTILITGTSSGIGAAMVGAMLEEGAEVHGIDINKGMEAAGFTWHKTDVSDVDQVKRSIDAIARKVRIDALINNAGIAHVGDIEHTSEDDMDRLYAVNIKGVYHCARAVIPHMKSRGGGVIINMASIASSVGLAQRFAYSMTKGAVLTMTYSIAKDYVKDNIRCNCISPARVHTPFVDGFIAQNFPGKEAENFARLSATQPIGRMGLPEEVAALAVFLCSDKAGFITGTDYPIDGGFIRLNS